MYGGLWKGETPGAYHEAEGLGRSDLRKYVFREIRGTDPQSSQGYLCNLNVQVFLPVIDNRYRKEEVVSHNGESFEATPIQHAGEIDDSIDENIDVIGIDVSLPNGS